MINLNQLQIPVGGSALFPYPPTCAELVQYTNWKKIVDDVYLKDLTKGRTTGVRDGRGDVRGAIAQGDLTRSIRVASYPSTAFTYIDHTTGLEVADTLDVSGDFVVPTNGVRSMTVDGYTANFQETNNDTAVEFTNLTTGERIYGEIQGATGSDRVETDKAESGMNLYGYTESYIAKPFVDGELYPDYHRVVDGVVDLETADITDVSNATHETDNDSITVTSDGAANIFEWSSVGVVSANVLHTIKITATTISGNNAPRMLIRNLADDASLVSKIFVSGESYETTFTPTDGGYNIRLYGSWETLDVSVQAYTDFKVYEGTEEPEAGQPVEGNSYTTDYYYPNTTTPVPDGCRSLTVNGKCGWSTVAGDNVQGDADWSGGLRADLRIVDGVVDLNTEEYTDNNTTHTYFDGLVSVTSTANAYANTRVEYTCDNTEKLIVFKGVSVSGADNARMLVQTLAGANIDSKEAISDNVEYRLLITPTDGGLRLLFMGTWATAEIATKEYYDFAVYDASQFTNPLTDPLPESAQPVDGNSAIQVTKLYSVTQADKTLTEQWYDHTDEDNLVKNVIPFSTLLNTTDNDQQFIADPWIQAFYSAQVTGDCLTKVRSFMGF